MNLWKESNPDYNDNKTVADVALALKQFKQMTQQPQNSASTRARYYYCTIIVCLIIDVHLFEKQSDFCTFIGSFDIFSFIDFSLGRSVVVFFTILEP